MPILNHLYFIYVRIVLQGQNFIVKQPKNDNHDENKLSVKDWQCL